MLKVNKYLQDPTEGLASQILSATLLRTFYEMLNCTEGNSCRRGGLIQCNSVGWSDTNKILTGL